MGSEASTLGCVCFTSNVWSGLNPLSRGCFPQAAGSPHHSPLLLWLPGLWSWSICTALGFESRCWGSHRNLETGGPERGSGDCGLGGHGAGWGSAKAQKSPWGIAAASGSLSCTTHTLVSWPFHVHLQVCTKIINPKALFCFL